MSGEVFRYWPYAQTAQRAGVAAGMPPNFPLDVPPTRAPDQWRNRVDVLTFEPPAAVGAPILDAMLKADNAFIFGPKLAYPAQRAYPQAFEYVPQPIAALIAGPPTQGNGDVPPAPLQIPRYPYWPAYPNQQAGEEFIAATSPQSQGNADVIPPTPIPYPERERPHQYQMPPNSALPAALGSGVLIFAPQYTFDYDPVYPGRRWQMIYKHGKVAAFSSVQPDAAPVTPDNPPPKTIIPEAAYLRRPDGRLPPINLGNLAFIPLIQGAADVIPPLLRPQPYRAPDPYPQQPRFLAGVIPQPQGNNDFPPALPEQPIAWRETWRPIGLWNPTPGWLASIEDTELVPGPDAQQPLCVYERPRYPRIEPIKPGIAVLIPQPQGVGDTPGPFTIARYDYREPNRPVVPPPFFTQGTPPVPQAPPGPLIIASYPPPPDVRTRYYYTYLLQPGVIVPDVPPGFPGVTRVPPVIDARALFTPPAPTVAWLAPESVGFIPPVRIQQPTLPWRPMPQTFVRIAPFFIDQTPPTVPVQSAAVVISNTAIDVNWAASTDAGSGVAGYFIYIGGFRVTQFPVAGIIYHATGLAPGSTYAFQVSAVDNAGNESGLSNVQFATTTGGATGGLIFTRRRWRSRGGR